MFLYENNIKAHFPPFPFTKDLENFYPRMCKDQTSTKEDPLVHLSQLLKLWLTCGGIVTVICVKIK